MDYRYINHTNALYAEPKPPLVIRQAVVVNRHPIYIYIKNTQSTTYPVAIFATSQNIVASSELNSPPPGPPKQSQCQRQPEIQEKNVS